MLRIGFLACLLFGSFFLSQPGTSNNLSGISASVSDDVKSEEAKKEFDALNKGFQAAIAQLRERVKNAESKDKQAELLVTQNPAPEFAKKFMALAKKYPGTKSAVGAVLFAVGQTKGAQKNEAMTHLLENYPTKVRLDKIAASFKKEVPSQDIEDWYFLMIKHAEKDSVRASVMYDYAKYISQFPTFQKTLAINPVIAGRLPKEQLAYINAKRTAEQDDRLAGVLNELISKYGELKLRRATYAELAKRELFDLRHLQVGMEAPEVEGNDLDGIPFKLSDYRGKVVMLDFWGHWCPPCRAMYSHEQEIVRMLADKPFVLLGVNSDQELETVKEAVVDESLGWRHFWNGPKGTNGPISNQWNVEGWPTVYLIDENGIIRYKEVLGKEIDRGIETLMAEMGHEIELTEEATRISETVPSE